MIKLHHAEALEWLNDLEDEKWNMIFMDPPDNIGLKYPGVNDMRSDYYLWLKALLVEAIIRVETPGVLWLSYYHKHDLQIKVMVNWIIKFIKPSWECRTFIWRFTFGQYRKTDCGSGYRPILRLSSPGVEWKTDEIKVMSKRQLLGDPRAKGPRVPDDVWEFPRVVGNFIERRKWIPTQHPEGLIERIVKLSGKERVLELFSGSGTMIRVCKRLGVDLDTVELCGKYVKKLREEHNL